MKTITKESNYEIATVRITDNNFNASLHTRKVNNIEYFQYYHNNQAWEINSVQRIDDSELFMIGNYITCDGSHLDKPEAITRIGINKEFNVVLFTNTFHRNGININKARVHYFKFITNDGVKIFLGDTYYLVDEYYYNLSLATANGYTDYSKLTKLSTFAFEDNAKRFIKDNKPVYSRNDIRQLMSDIYNDERELLSRLQKLTL